MYMRTPNSTYSITKSIEPPCQETQLTLGKRWVITMTCFNSILQRRFPKSPEFHTAKLQRLSTGRCIDVTRQSKNNALLPWLTSGSRRKTSYKLKHSNWNMLFQLLKLHNLFFFRLFTPQTCCIIKLQGYLPIRCLNSRYYKTFNTGLTSIQNQESQFHWIKLTELFNSVASSFGPIPPWLLFILQPLPD